MRKTVIIVVFEVFYKMSALIKISFRIQLQIMNFQSSECSASNLNCLSLMSSHQENSCSKSSQEKNHSQSQNSLIS